MTDLTELTDQELLDLYHNKRNIHSAQNAMQMAFKISLNSLYGAMANPYFRYYSTDIAEGITLTGQYIIKYIGKEINQFLAKKLKIDNFDGVISSDTDSVMLCLDELVKKVVPENTPTIKVIDFIDRFSKTVLEPEVRQKFAELAEYLNAFENKMDMKREAIADRGIWRAKKNYVIQVYDNEGVRFNEPYLKAVGVETAKSSTPEIVRKALKKSLNVLLNQEETDIHDFVKEFRQEFMNAPIEQISFPRGVSDLDKWLKADGSWNLGAPIHVKASIKYNELLKTTGLVNKHPMIHNGDKIKFIYLKTPNPTRNNAIALVNFLHKEFELDDYIDKELQFNKTFLEPLRSFTDILSWTTEFQNTLFDFFGEEAAELNKTYVSPLATSPISIETKPKVISEKSRSVPIKRVKKIRPSVDHFFQ